MFNGLLLTIAFDRPDQEMFCSLFRLSDCPAGGEVERQQIEDARELKKALESIEGQFFRVRLRDRKGEQELI